MNKELCAVAILAILAEIEWWFGWLGTNPPASERWKAEAGISRTVRWWLDWVASA